jgi:signal transduction histidine kinase
MEKKPNLLIIAERGKKTEKWASFFRNAGFPVGSVAGFQAGMEWLKEFEVDVLILDVDGLSVPPPQALGDLKRIRSVPDVIAVMPEESASGRGTEWVSAGACLCVPVSFPPESLANIISILFENRILHSRASASQRDGRALLESRGGFLTTLSYEIKAPLTAIAGAVKMLLGKTELDRPGQIQNVKNSELVEMIKRNADRILGFVGDVLELERIRRGDCKWDPKPVMPSRLMEDLLGEVKKIAELQRLSAVRRPDFVAPDLEYAKWVLECDHDQILKVGHQLALVCAQSIPKPRGITIGLRADEGEQGVKISFESDTGGIEPGELENIFELFRDFNAAEGRKDSYGLSLSLCKTIVEFNRGRIWAETEGVGKKISFGIFLPAQVV